MPVNEACQTGFGVLIFQHNYGDRMKMKMEVPGKVRLLMADNHISVREMLGHVLSADGRYEVVAETNSGLEALRLCEKVRPCMAIIDLSLRELNGAEVVRQFRSKHPAMRVMIFSGTSQTMLAAEALRAKPHGYVHKEEPLNVVREAISAISGGRGYFSGFATLLMEEKTDNNLYAMLTDRERAVLQMVAEGSCSKEIAGRLNVSSKTVEHHRATLMQKLGRHDVAGLTRYAVMMGLVMAG